MARFYTGNQYQDNALGGIGSFNPSASGTGVYCTISANNPPIIFGVTPQPYTNQAAFVCTTFYGYANTGVTGGTIQPQIQCADGLYRDYGPSYTVTVAGFFLSIIIPSPILGAQFNLTGTITGGTVFLEIDGLLG